MPQAKRASKGKRPSKAFWIPRWELRVCPWRRRPVVRRRTCCRRPWRRRPSDWQSMRSGRTGRGFRSLVSMRKKSPTSA